MSDENRFSTASGDADWDAIARAMAAEGAPEEREALRRHLHAHPEHAALMGALHGATERMSADAHASVDVEAALASVLARRDRAEAPAIPFRAPRAVPARRWNAPLLRAAAIVLLVLGGALVWRTMSRAPAAPAAQYATAAGATRELRLADGTRVRLGPASTLEVGAGYGGSAREVRVRGDAFFEVVHDTRPFVVRTHNAVVEDIGTAFTVRADSGAQTRVVVTSGVVALSGTGGAPDTLRAGDRGMVGGGQVVVERGAATAEDAAWTRGELIFRDAPLAEVAAELSRWYGVPITVSDAALGRRRVTATFDTSQEVDDVLQVLAATVGARVRRSGGGVVLSPARP